MLRDRNNCVCERLVMRQTYYITVASEQCTRGEENNTVIFLSWYKAIVKTNIIFQRPVALKYPYFSELNVD
jgi:hypothetical protein